MKRNLSVRSFLMPLSSVVFACLVVAVFTALGVLQQAAQTAAVGRELPIYCVQTEEKLLSLTFDAAWGNSDTDELLSLLAENKVKATFFVTGEWAEKYPEDVRKFFDAGHEIQNHSDAHPHPNTLSYEALVRDTAACDEKITAVTGTTPTLYRAPYGEYNDLVIRTLKSLGKQVVQWDVDSLDWKEGSAEEIADRAFDRVKNGSILLFHNDAKNTPAALKFLLPRLKEEGFSFCTVSELIPPGPFELTNEGRLVPKG